MKIKSISLKNYKGISHADIDIGGKSTVFFGVNGSGKTTILNAVSCILTRIIAGVSDGKFKPKDILTQDDIQYNKTQASILCSISLSKAGKEYIVSRTINRKQKSNGSKTEFDNFMQDLKQIYNNSVPVMVNYGINRSVFDIPLRIRNNHSFESIYAYENAIENKIDFRSFFMWFRNQEDYEQEIKNEKKDFDYEDKSLKCVRYAVCFMLDGFDNLKVCRNPLRMTVSKNGTNLKIDQLSDGEKCTLALIGDLARRIALANPNLNNPLEGDGVVLIDEIELHMHTSWQRKVINKLKELFPNVQFIITTHSPQVLGELDDSYNIYEVNNVNNNLCISKVNSLIAWDSNLILEELMGTDSLNSKMKNLIDNMYKLIQEKNFSEAESVANELDSLSVGKNTDVVAARTLIRRGRMNYEKNN